MHPLNQDTPASHQVVTGKRFRRPERAPHTITEPVRRCILPGVHTGSSTSLTYDSALATPEKGDIPPRPPIHRFLLSAPRMVHRRVPIRDQGGQDRPDNGERNPGSGAVTAALISPGRGSSRCCFHPSDRTGSWCPQQHRLYLGRHQCALKARPHRNIFFPPQQDLFPPAILPYFSIQQQSNRIGGDSPDLPATNTKSTSLTAPAKVAYNALQSKEGIAISVDLAGTVGISDLPAGLLTTPPPIAPYQRSCGDVRLVKTHWSLSLIALF